VGDSGLVCRTMRRLHVVGYVVRMHNMVADPVKMRGTVGYAVRTARGSLSQQDDSNYVESALRIARARLE
jgi:hypothetical protein